LKAPVCNGQIIVERPRRAIAGQWVSVFQSPLNVRDTGIVLQGAAEQWSKGVLCADITGRWDGAGRLDVRFFAD